MARPRRSTGAAATKGRAETATPTTTVSSVFSSKVSEVDFTPATSDSGDEKKNEVESPSLGRGAQRNASKRQLLVESDDEEDIPLTKKQKALSVKNDAFVEIVVTKSGSRAATAKKNVCRNILS